MELKVFMSFMEMYEVRAMLFVGIDAFFVCTFKIFLAFGKFQYRRYPQKFFE